MIDIDGVLLINKPSGCTSHDLVAFVRRTFSIRKVGHCGTLDPLATGLLMLVLGKATKIQDLLMSEDKVYAGRMKLGESTDTQDQDGKILETKPVRNFSKQEIEEVMQKYTGDFYQIPPMFSAIKKAGVPLYKMARQGKVVERKPRLITIHKYSCNKLDLPFIDFEITCSKGFYVRTYCHDIGETMGCGAHLTKLARLRSGNFSLDKAIEWEDLKNLPARYEDLSQYVLTLPQVSQMRR